MASEVQVPNDWRYPSIGELEAEGVISEIQDGNHGDRHPTSIDYVSDGVPFVMAKDLCGGRLNLTQCSFISRVLADSLRIGFAKPGDILLTHKATMGRVAIVPAGYDYVMLTPQVTYYRIGDPGRLSNLYLKFAFLGNDFQHQLNSDSDQSTRKYIGITAQRRLRIPLPPIDEQTAIARILGALDEKIELNRRMNETLEALARTLFKSWFVDFHPVLAKAEGLDSGLPESLEHKFPRALDDSELGKIPRGWEIRGLDEIAIFLNGLALQKYPPKDGRVLPVIKIAQLRAGDTDGADSASADLEPKYIVNDGDVLFSWSGSLECVLWAGSRGALNQHLFKVTSADYPKWFYYLWIHEHLAEFRRIASAKATTMGHIQRHHLSEAKVVLPSRELLLAGGGYIGPIIDAIVKRRIESRDLASIRDVLLPRLISGDLRIKNANRIVGVDQ